MKPIADMVARAAFLTSLVAIGLTYGYLAHQNGWFPHRLVVSASEGWQAAQEQVHATRPWYYFDTAETERYTQPQPTAAAPGLTLITYVGADQQQFADVVDHDGEVVQRWTLDWFKIWPHPTHLTPDLVPKSPPGTVVNGALVMENGDLIFNFDACGLVRLDAAGRVVWRAPYRTHHSLSRDDQGDIWTSIRHTRLHKLPGYPSYLPPFEEYTIARFSPADGRLLQEISLFDLLRDNDLESLLYLASTVENSTQVSGDTLHVNDVEVFTRAMTPGFFQPGDIMVSMRRTDAVVVFDPARRRVKYVVRGPFVRQHDPDFTDGHTIAVFDNHNTGQASDGAQSRIVVESVPDGRHHVAFAGTPRLPFFSYIVGRHQRLPNGNLLLVESTGGRVLEVDPRGNPVWQFMNLVGPGVVGLVTDAQRLPAAMDATFFARGRAATRAP